MHMKFIEHENKPCILLKRECDTTVGCIVGIKDFENFLLFLEKKDEENWESFKIRVERKIPSGNFVFFIEGEKRELNETWGLCADDEFCSITPPIYTNDLLDGKEEQMLPTMNGGKFTAWGDYITPKGLK